MQKIQALKQTIYNLENGVYEYNWWNTDKCNCGVVARVLLEDGFPKENGLFENGSSSMNGEACSGFHGVYEHNLDFCKRMGIPLPKVFQALHDAGFTVKEMSNLEKGPGSKESLVKYLKAWVELLEEEQKTTQPADPQPKIQYIQKVVQVPSTLNEQVKQVIQIAEATS